MSLIFLKNDDRSIKDGVNGTGSNMKPYRWSNYFTNPIKIPPNSQVAFIKSNFQTGVVGDFEDADGFFTIGIPQLNAPMPLYVSQNNVNNFTVLLNNIGRDMNLYGSDGDFNHIMLNTNTLIGNGNVRQDEYQTGFNVILKDDNKCDIRCVQRGINDIFNQGFNNCGFIDAQVSPQGIGTGTGDNSTFYKDNGFLTTNCPYGQVFSVNKLAYPVYNTLFPIKSTSPNQPYNTNYALAECNASGIGIPTPLITPNAGAGADITHMFPYSFTDGVFAMCGSTCGIKKNVFMDGPPTATIGQPNGGGLAGHPSIAGAGSGGYAHIWIGKQYGGQNLNQGAEFMYSAPFFDPLRVGFTAIAPISFGVVPADIVDLEYGDTANESRVVYNTLIDLNNSGLDGNDGPLGNCNFNLASGSHARYTFGVDIQVVGNSLVAQAKILNPESIFINSSYINVGPILDIGELSAGFDTTDNTPFGGGQQGGPTIFNINYGGTAFGGRRNMELHFRFRWTSPYTFCVEYILEDDPNETAGTYSMIFDTPYLPSAGGGAGLDPRTNWKVLYDMKQDPTVQSQYLIPSYYGDMRTVIYPSPIRAIHIGTRGYYDNRFTNFGGSIRGGQNNKYPAMGNLPFFYQPPDELGNPLVQDFTGGYFTPKLNNQAIVPETFVANGATAGLSQKNIFILMDELKNLSSSDRIMDELGNPILGVGQPANLHLGTQLGIISAQTGYNDIVDLNNDILGSGVPYVEYGINGVNTISSGNDEFNLHYQLTNFGIGSQQGVASTNNKSIMVVSNVEVANTNLNAYRAYSFSQPFPLWIDLNNFGPLNVNNIDVLITDDDNNEARNLVGKHSCVIAFRQKPKSDEGYIPNNIPVKDTGFTRIQ